MACAPHLKPMENSKPDNIFNMPPEFLDQSLTAVG